MPKKTKRAPRPLYESFADFRFSMTDAELRKKFNRHAKKANAVRLMSAAPQERLTGADVWEVFVMDQGCCQHCGSLAVEGRPSRADGAPLPWEPIGRRIGSLDHLKARFHGGGNDLSNLVWSCLWCNTRQSKRQPGAKDHGGHYPDEPAPLQPWDIPVELREEADHLGFDPLDDDDPCESPYY
jgi:hypothetical protein